MKTMNLPPTIVVANVSEAFCDFLCKDPDIESRRVRIKTEQHRGDRTLIWVGDPKLVVASYPIPSLDYVQRELGFPETELIYPQEPTESLSEDILRESHLLARCVDYAGEQKVLRIIPYATTWRFMKLIETIQALGITTILPESPKIEDFWLIQYLDTKVGFRQLVSSWLCGTSVSLPKGFICQSYDEAASIVSWFNNRHETCIVKANMGSNGYGNVIITPKDFATIDDIKVAIKQNPFLQGDLIIVEEFISSTNLVSPSFEGFIPPKGDGAPRMTYISTQLFQGYGDFCGVVATKEHRMTKWYKPLMEAGLKVAHEMQELGYVGFFDIDTIVNDAGQVYPVEINPRRTGGTHIHDFGEHILGDDYLDQVVLVSIDPVSTGSISSFTELTRKLRNLLYPIKNKEHLGIIPTVTSPLSENEYGCVILGPSEEDVLALREAMYLSFQK